MSHKSWNYWFNIDNRFFFLWNRDPDRKGASGVLLGIVTTIFGVILYIIGKVRTKKDNKIKENVEWKNVLPSI